MSRSPLVRPELGAHVAPRLYVRGDKRLIVLHDTGSQGVAALDGRAWALLGAADGTRDVSGLARAAGHAGYHPSPADVAAFVSALAGPGLVVEGADGAPAAASSAARPAADRASEPSEPVVTLPDFTLACDGGGSCCRSYPTTLFAPAEAARARASCPEVLGGGDDELAVFTPERGVRFAGARAVAMVDGACAYLAPDQRCRLELAAGPAAKPFGCRLFPATFCHDGTRVRVSVAPECACVFRSMRPHGFAALTGGPVLAAGGAGGAGEPPRMALVPDGVRVRADLDPAVVVRKLPEVVALVPGVSVPRAAFVAWCDGLPWSQPSAWRAFDRDAARALWELARAVEVRGLAAAVGLEGATGVHARGAPAEGALPDDAPFHALKSALVAALAARAARDAGFRAERDWVRQALAWLVRAAPRLDGAALPCRDALGESFYLHALGFGLGLADDEVPLALALRDRALRLWLARALAAELAAAPADVCPDGSFREPLALVEALLRGHGLDDYAGSAAGP